LFAVLHIQNHLTGPGIRKHESFSSRHLLFGFTNLVLPHINTIHDLLHRPRNSLFQAPKDALYRFKNIERSWGPFLTALPRPLGRAAAVPPNRPGGGQKSLASKTTGYLARRLREARELTKPALTLKMLKAIRPAISWVYLLHLLPQGPNMRPPDHQPREAGWCLIEVSVSMQTMLMGRSNLRTMGGLDKHPETRPFIFKFLISVPGAHDKLGDLVIFPSR
jgi:hypothetical protein